MSSALQSILNAAASKKIKNTPAIVWRSPYTGKNIRSTSPINSNKSFHSLEETNYYKTTEEFKAEILHHINLNKAREKWRGNAKLMGLYDGFRLLYGSQKLEFEACNNSKSRVFSYIFFWHPKPEPSGPVHLRKK